MSTSGTYNFTENRDQIIRGALRKCGAIASGETPDAQTVQDCADQLNAMVKALASTGIHIWTETESVLFTQIGTGPYVLGSGSTAQSSTVYSTTNLVSDVNSSATVIQIASTSNVSNGVSIGVTLNAGTIFFTTVVSSASTVITLADALPDSAAAGANVYITSPQIVRPLRIVSVRRWDVNSQLETMMLPLSKMDYNNLPNKTATGTITQWYYNPQGGAVNVGILYLWPTPSDTVTNNIKFTWYRPIQDFDNPGDTPDLPQEWIDTLIWNLAWKMAPEYGVTMEVYGMIKEQATMSLELAMGFDKEPESTYFGVDFSTMQYGR